MIETIKELNKSCKYTMVFSPTHANCGEIISASLRTHAIN